MRSDTEDIRRQPRARTRTTATTSVKVDTEDTDKDTDKVAIGDTVKFAIVSSVFVGLRTFSVSSICPSVVVGIRPIRRHRTF